MARSGGLANADHLRFDPGFDSGIEIAGFHACRIDRFADAYRDCSGQLQERIPAPEFACIMCNWHHRRPGVGCKPRTANAVFALFPRGNACPLRENYYPESLLKPVFSLFDDLFQCSFTGAAIDGDRAGQGETPAKKWHPQQFFLENPDLSGEYLLKCECFPGGLMLR